ncbi:MAG: CCA tRNA nucleotidyltransferase [Candidatus Aenigmarchaeota archaeon]|nr:CCA tRNA nucleotidyltransferase [Candidatus Aenigmarchaeota archaeon]
MEKVLQIVLKKIRPKASDEKSLTELAKRAVELANEVSKKYHAKAILAGSLTRGTWLPGKREFDVFVLFPPDLPEDKLEDYGLAVGKEVVKRLKGKFFVEYAQHPYTSGIVQGISIDIVPCYEVESAEKIKSAVDRTPFHVRYIEKNLPLKLADDVRLLKQLLSANRIYGADAKTQGFSGYVSELLVIKYGGFSNVIKATSAWQPGTIIDLENSYKKEDYQQLIRSFKGNPLILIDPTDKNRNTASALSVENFLKFKKLAKSFIAKPNANYFFESKTKPLTGRELERILAGRKTELIVVKFKPPKVVPDILWPQLRRFTERLSNILEETKYEFKVLRSDCYTDEKDVAIALLEMEISKLPPIQKRIGPSVFDIKDASRFLEKYNQPLAGPFVEDDKWVVEIRRRFVTAHEKVSDSLKNKEDILKAKGVPNYIAAQLAKRFEIVSDGEKLVKLASKNKEFGIFLRNYFKKDKPAL